MGGTDISDQSFMDKLRDNRSVTTNPEEDWCSQERMRYEEQQETIHRLQATVEAQGRILKAMANRLNITDYEN